MIDHASSEPAGAHGTGYKLIRIYAVEQVYRNRADETHSEAGATGRLFQLGWDWRVAGPRAFDVLLAGTALPCAEQPDEAKVAIAATFEATDGAVSVPFQEFVRVNAVALLVPFVREALAQLTARGAFGPFLLTPINVLGVANTFDPAKTSGLRQLREDPALARQFGLVDQPVG